MRQYYSYYEDGKTHLLEIDHEEKVFSALSIPGKIQSSGRFIEIDQTAYADEIRKIDRDYQWIDNNFGLFSASKKNADPELTPEEVVRGLECLNYQHDRLCGKCPIYQKLESRQSCRKAILDTAIKIKYLFDAGLVDVKLVCAVVRTIRISIC